LEMNLTFVQQIIDVCCGNRVVVEDSWHLRQSWRVRREDIVD
jgi:hypothetical protein